MLCIVSETKCGNICQWKLKFFKVCFCLTLSQELEIIRQRWLRLWIVQSSGCLEAGINQASNFATITKLCCHCNKSKIQNLRNILSFISLLFIFLPDQYLFLSVAIYWFMGSDDSIWIMLYYIPLCLNYGSVNILQISLKLTSNTHYFSKVKIM